MKPSTRALDAQKAFDCCKSRQKEAKLRLLNDIQRWIKDVQQVSDSIVPQAKVAVMDAKPQMGLYFAQLAPQFVPLPGEISVPGSLPTIGGEPFPGSTPTEFQRLVRMPRPFAATPQTAAAGAAAVASRISRVAGAVTVVAIGASIAAQQWWDGSAQSSVNQITERFYEAIATLKGELAEDDEQTRDCAECIQNAIFPQDKPQHVTLEKVRKRV